MAKPFVQNPIAENSHPGREASSSRKSVSALSTSLTGYRASCASVICDKVDPNPSMSRFLAGKESRTSNALQDQRRFTGHTPEMVVITCDTWSDRVELIIDNLALEGLSSVLLSNDPAVHVPAGTPSLLLGCIVNNAQAGSQFESLLIAFRNARANCIAIVDGAGGGLAGILRGHGYEVLNVESVSEANAIMAKHSGAGLILLGSGQNPSTVGPEPPSHPMLVFTEEFDSRLNCQWLRKGAVEVFHRQRSEQEIMFSVARLIEQQNRWKALSKVAYRDEKTGIRNENYLMDVGTRFYAAAQRGQASIALAVIKLEGFEEFLGSFEEHDQLARRREIYALMGSGIRASDILVQRSEDEFVCLVTGAGSTMISEIFERLRGNMMIILDQRYSCAPEVSVGGTAALGVTFDGMIRRASMALHQTRLRFDDKIIIL